MKILAIDSSGLAASVAIASEDKIIAEYSVNYKKTHSQTLLPMLDEICRMVQLDLNEIDAIALANGPGSFTGLRIGTATAKGLGLALGKPLIPVPTLEGLAWNAWGASELVCPMMDARRNQVYTGIYKVSGGVEVIMDQEPMDIHELINKLNVLLAGNDGMVKEADVSVTFLGDGVPIYQETIWNEIGVPCRMAPASVNRQRGASIAAYGEILYKEKKYVSADDFAPEYLRKSQAERVKESGK